MDYYTHHSQNVKHFFQNSKKYFSASKSFRRGRRPRRPIVEIWPRWAYFHAYRAAALRRSGCRGRHPLRYFFVIGSVSPEPGSDIGSPQSLSARSQTSRSKPHRETVVPGSLSEETPGTSARMRSGCASPCPIHRIPVHSPGLTKEASSADSDKGSTSGCAESSKRLVSYSPPVRKQGTALEAVPYGFRFSRRASAPRSSGCRESASRHG